MYSPERYYFVTVLLDISKKKERLNAAEKLVQISEEFLQENEPELNFQKITDDLLKITSAKFVLFNLYNRDGESFTTRAISGEKSLLNKVTDIVGYNIKGKNWSDDPDCAEKIRANQNNSSSITRFPSVKEAFNEIIPEKLAINLETVFNIGEVVSIKITKKNILLGSFLLVMENGKKFDNDILAEIYSRQLGMLITRKRAEEALRKSEEKHRLLITQMKQGLAVHEMIFDGSGNPDDYRFLDANDSFEKMTGLKRENIIGKTVKEILPGTESYWIEKYGHVAMTGEPLQYENYSKEMGKYYEVVAYSPRPKEFATIISDITDRRSLALDLAKEKKLVETTLSSVADGVISTDNKGNIVFLNRVAESLTGWMQEEAKGKSIEEVFTIVNEHTRDKSENLVKKVLESGKPLELATDKILISKNGIERPIEDSVAPIIQEHGEIIGMVVVFRDFSEKKQKQDEIEYLSYHDQLTGLYNRRFYEEELKRLDTKDNLPLTIVMADVNGLKLINDSFGHALGDDLLKKAAEVISKECRSGDIVARIGGDEFVILMPKTDETVAEKIVKHISNLSKKEQVGSFNVSISFGQKTRTSEKESIQEIFKVAEDQMYRHKLYKKSSMRSKTIDLIMKTLFEKCNREMLHSKRVGEICNAIATRMNFDEDLTYQIRVAGLMHDIGKMGIDEKILNKPLPLNAEEQEDIRRHPEIGYRILSSTNQFSEIAIYVLEHHERWDG